MHQRTRNRTEERKGTRTPCNARDDRKRNDASHTDRPTRGCHCTHRGNTVHDGTICLCRFHMDEWQLTYKIVVNGYKIFHARNQI